ncbi:MAG TPA: aminoacyl-tRNA hydrolase [Burkholderiales bacterium]|nr:aminoacyl-tRNA hydrolase [Burkholderiales bacterium]
MKLVVGLGNPGRRYEATRHNAGFWFVDEVARGVRAEFRREARFHGEVARVPGTELWLLKPETHMNNSGRAVTALAGFYRIPADQILVAHDELDLRPGDVRLKFGGGLSGHNGLRDVAPALGTHDFWRLRIGIGHPRDIASSQQEVVDYVLHVPSAEDRKGIDQALDSALAVWPLIAAHDMQSAMLKLHTKAGAREVGGEGT